MTTTTIERVFTETDQKNFKKRESLEYRYDVLSSALVEIECADGVSEQTFRIVEKYIDREKAEIEQELLMIPSELEE